MNILIVEPSISLTLIDLNGAYTIRIFDAAVDMNQTDSIGQQIVPRLYIF